MIEAPVGSSEEALLADLQQLMALVEDSRVEEARALAPVLAARWPESQAVQHMARVLEPPKAAPTGRKSGRPLDREREWLRSHAQEYPGCWLAVYEDRLIAADPDRLTVVAAARAALGEEGALLHFQPGSPE